MVPHVAASGLQQGDELKNRVSKSPQAKAKLEITMLISGRIFCDAIYLSPGELVRPLFHANPSSLCASYVNQALAVMAHTTISKQDTEQDK